MLYFMSSHYVSQACAERACLFPYLMQRIGSELMSVEWVLFALLPRWVVKEMESNARTAILSLPYRLFTNPTIRSDACLIFKSVHTHSILTSTCQLAVICFSVQGWVTTHFLFDFVFYLDIHRHTQRLHKHTYTHKAKYQGSCIFTVGCKDGSFLGPPSPFKMILIFSIADCLPPPLPPFSISPFCSHLHEQREAHTKHISGPGCPH